MPFKCVTLASLKWRSGLPLRDGSHVRHSSGRGTIDRVAKRMEGVFHDAEVKYGKDYFGSNGYRVFPWHIGLEGLMRWADFAIARYRRVILVECLTDWRDDALERKEILIPICELWFITESFFKNKLRRRGYKCEILPCPDTDEFRSLNAKFWICRPEKSKKLS
jgi:hypothetical protein